MLACRKQAKAEALRAQAVPRRAIMPRAVQALALADRRRAVLVAVEPVHQAAGVAALAVA
jgi:hypothetical protein